VSELDLKGSIDIAVSGAVSNLAALEKAMESVRKQEAAGTVSAGEAKALASLATAWERTSRSISSAADAQGRAEVNLSKVAAQESARRIAERRAEADAAGKSASQITAQLKAQQAAEKQLVARSRTTTSNPTTTGGATVNRNLAAALGQADDPQKAQLRDMAAYYSAIEAMDAKSAAERIKNEQRVAQQKAAQNRQSLIQQERDEAAIRKNELSAMRASATDSLGLPDAGSLNQTRYALYDVSTTLGVLGAALSAGGVAAVTFGAQYESAFTQVERTSLPTREAASQLKGELNALSETIPVGFEQLSSIAALGAQMNIANEDLAQFADTTARYAAVTGLSNETVATSFGAIFELTNTGANEMEKVASAINLVGVSSVATDSEILSLAQNIGASTTQAGFLAEETIGLAGALASLRIQPEQARGVILRLFSDFDKAASQGGEALAGYAKIMGITTNAAQSLWKTDSSAFFDQLLQGLSKVENLNGALSDLGITETRESNVLQRLAGNYDTYAASMQNASQAYEDGTFLGESYGRTADDVATRVKILVNSIQNLLAKAGQSIGPILGPVLTVVTAIVQGLESIPAPILGLLTTVTLLAGGFALLVAGGAALVASGFAVQTALAGIKAQGGQDVTVLQALRSTVSQLTASLGINTAAARINAVTLGSIGAGARGAVGGVVGLSAAQGANAAATVAATGATRGFGAALLATPVVNIVAALSILVPLVFTLVGGFNAASEASAQAGKDLLAAGGGADAFAEALRADTENAENAGKGLGTLTTNISEQARTAAEAADATQAHQRALAEATGAADEAARANGSAAGALQEQTFLIGENSQAWIANALYKQAAADAGGKDALNQIFNDDQLKAAYNSAGIDISQAIADGMGQDGGVQFALLQQIEAAKGKLDAARSRGEAVDGNLYGDYEALASLLVEVGNNADAMGQQFEVTQGVAGALGVEIGGIADVADEGGSAVADLADNVSALFDAASGASSFASDMNALRDSIDESGFSFDALSAGGTANIEALGSALASATTYGSTLGLSAQDSMAQALFSIGGDTDQIIALMQSLAATNPTLYASLNIDDVLAKYQQMQSLGIGGALSLASAQSNLDRLKQQRTKLQDQVSSASASGGGKSAQRDAARSAKIAADNQQKLQDAIKTTAEYARDMGTAMKEAFDKKYGVQQAMDEVTTKFASLRDRIEEAKEKVNSLTADLRKLASDRNILQIQLSVAQDYGDSTRAEAIGAALDQNTADQANTKRDLAAATAAASTELVGNTAAAVANRAAVLGLITAYQGQIEAFAATGASAAQVSAYTRQLQGQFEQQLVQLGYNANSVRGFAGTFDLLTAAVNRVPTRKEVKVTADTSQAMGGLNSVGSKISSLSGQLSSLNAQIAQQEAEVAKQARAQPLIDQLRALNEQLTAAASGPNKDNLNSRTNAIQGKINAINQKLASGNYASGGLITGGQRPANRGVDNTTINAQYGEGVVNLKGMDYLGTDGLNAINNQQNPFPPSVVYVSSPSTTNSGTVEVELSPIDRQLLAAAGNVMLSIGPDVVARATNAANLNTARRGANG